MYVVFLVLKCFNNDDDDDDDDDDDIRRKMLDYLPAHHCKRSRLFGTNKNPERRLFDNYHRERDASSTVSLEQLYRKYLQLCWNKPYYGYVHKVTI